MPNIEDISPRLSSSVAQGGVADSSGNVVLASDATDLEAATLFDPRAADLFLYGIPNGGFAVGPANSAENIEPANNPLSDWLGPVQVSGGAFTAQWVTDATVTYGRVLRMTLHPGAASDEGYLQAIAPVGSGSALYTTIDPTAIVDNSTGDTGMVAKITFQYLTATGTTTGAAISETTANNKAAPALLTPTNSGTFLTTPADAAYIRIRIGMARNTAAATANGSIDFHAVHLLRYIRHLLVTDGIAPATYEPLKLFQQNGTVYLQSGSGNATDLALAGPAGDAFLEAANAVSLSAGTNIALSAGAGQINIDAGLNLTTVDTISFSTRQDNLAVDTSAIMVWLTNTAGASRSVTGIVAPAAGASHVHYLFNVSSSTNPINLANEDVNSTAANRIRGPNDADYVLSPGDGAMLIYYGTGSRWYIVAGT